MKKDKNLLIVYPHLHIHLDDGAKHRLNSFIETYHSAGYNVTVLALFALASIPYINNKKLRHKNAKWLLFPSLPLFRSLFLQRLTIFYSQVLLFCITRLYNFELIQAEHAFGGKICKFYSKKKSKLIVDFHGDSVDETLFVKPKINDHNWRIKTLKIAIRTSIDISDFIIVISQNLIDVLQNRINQKITNYCIIPCNADIDRFNVERFASEYSNKLVLGYLGGLNKWQNLPIILKITNELRLIEKNIFFLLLTNSSTELIKNELEILGKDNYAVLSLTHNEVPEYLNKMDISFLIRDNRPLNIVSSPTKISESLAAGVPVVATQYSGDINQIVTHKKNGFILNDTNISKEDFEELLKYIRSVKQERKKYSILCKNSVKNRTWNKYSEDLLLKINSICK